MNLDSLSELVVQWADQKGLLKKENSNKQMLKVLEEVGELSGALLRDDREGIIDGIGDAFVTLIILAQQQGLSPEYCLESAYDEIKGRTGKTKDGIFIKENE